MKTISLNGTELALKPFTYDNLVAAESTLEAIAATGERTGLQRTQDSVAVLKVIFPDVPDAAYGPLAPGVLRQAAMDVYVQTYKRPEGEGEAPAAASA